MTRNDRGAGALRLTMSLTIIVLVCAAGVTGVFAGERLPVPADLKKLSLEELMDIEVRTVYAASKHEQTVTEAPSSVSIITSSDIKKYGYRTLADILRGVRSFYVTYDRNYTYVGVRGFGRPGDYNGRILLLIDGHRTNDAVYDQAFVGTEGIIDVDLIDRVEVVRGPGSSLYGSNAFFAVINVITKGGGDIKGAEASGEAARYSTYKGRLTYGNTFQNGSEAIVSGTGYDSKGQRLYFQEFDPAFSADPRAANNGIADHMDYDRYHSFFTKESIRDFTFEGAYVSRTKGIPTGAFSTDFADRGTKTADGHAYVDLKYDHTIGDQADLSAKIYYDHYWYEGDYVYGGVTTKDLGYGDWWGSEVKLAVRLFDVHRVIVGGEYIDNVRQDQMNYAVNPYALNLDDKRRSSIRAVYIQDEFSFNEKMTISAGVRYDYYSTFGGTTNPRFAFIYSPTEKNTVKLLYGSAFRTPNVFELYYSTPPVNLPNPDLKPEKIRTYELVYELRLDDGLSMTASGYYYTIKNLINQVPAGGGTRFENVDGVSAHGGELSLINRWSSGTEGRFSYTIQRAEDKPTGEPLTNSPAQLVKFNFSTPVIIDRVFAGIEEQYTGRRRTEAGDSTGGFSITNLTLFFRNLVERLELSASVYNLWDKKYGDPVSADLIPLDTVSQDGRNYRMKITYVF